nr:hypothetical protein BaRGS_032507 [Batillaria attramentaria]
MKNKYTTCMLDLKLNIGLAADKLEFYKQAKTEITYSKDGDQWTINVGIVGVPNGSRVFKFVLGEPYDSVNIDGTPLKSVITFEGGAFVEQHKEVGPKESEMSIIRRVNGDTMEVRWAGSAVRLLHPGSVRIEKPFDQRANAPQARSVCRGLKLS